jgi:beta-glucanase (GH16 family)
MIRYLIFSFAGLTLLLPGCKDTDSPKIAPANLTVETTIASDGSGLVTFSANAEHAETFVFYFGEAPDDPVTSADGIATHNYLSSGTYTAKVVARYADNLSREKSVGINVHVKEPSISSAGYSTPLSYAGKTLVWQDEFTGDHLNTNNWNYETGPFNNELQYYQQQNTIVQDGYLFIKAKKETVGGKAYTSSRLTTEGKKAFKYGRVDIRAMAPKTQGLFPALWMLGSTFSTIDWPRCGEIDIMETICGGGRDSVVYGTAHWALADGMHVLYGGHRGLTDGHLLGDEFHVYSIVWTSTEIKWYIDDIQYHIIDITPAELSELRAEFFFIFNVAVGGEWAGPPNGTTVFPQRMVVDYIRVFQ